MKMMPLRLAFVATISVVAASVAAAQQGWVGKTIITKKDDIKIGHTGEDGRQIYIGELDGINYKVLGDKDGWLQVNDGRGNTGWFDKADALLLDDAIEYLSARIRQDPSVGPRYYKRAVVWWLRGEADIAIKDFNEALRLDPSAVVYSARGNAWSDKKDYDMAIADYNEAIRLDPKKWSVYYNRGNAWSDKKDYDMAIADYNEAIRLDPKFVTAHYNRAIALGKKKNYDKAIADYDEAIRLDRTHVNARYNRANARMYKKEFDKAITDYSEVIRLDAKYVNAYNGRGEAWFAKKQYDKAIADYGEAIRLDSENAFAHNGRAWLWATASDGKFRDGKMAVDSAKRAVSLESKDARYMGTLAAAYAESGDFAEAVRWQEKALEDPQLKNDKDARRRLELYRDKKPYRQE
jgi:tetratricopeptide (TPR) repeat protein